jgi:hypothetical protein
MDPDEVVVQLFVVIDRPGPAPVLRRRRHEIRKRVVRIALAAAIVDAVVVGALQVVAAEIHPDPVQVVVDVRGAGCLRHLVDLVKAEAHHLAVSRLAADSHVDLQVVKLSLVALLVWNVGPPVRRRAEAPLDRAHRRHGRHPRGHRHHARRNGWINERTAIPRAESAVQGYLLVGAAVVRDRYVVRQCVVGHAVRTNVSLM